MDVQSGVLGAAVEPRDAENEDFFFFPTVALTLMSVILQSWTK